MYALDVLLKVDLEMKKTRKFLLLKDLFSLLFSPEISSIDRFEAVRLENK